jgi:hypothetical protein
MVTFENQPRTSFVNLMKNLQQITGEAGPNVRVGGNSADESVYIPASTPLPTNDTYRISSVDFQAYLTAVPLWNGTITPGVNFRNATSPDLAVAHISALSQAIPWSQNLVEGIEVGNECDLYPGNGIRNSTFYFNDYQSQFDMYASALQSQAGVPFPRIQGATFCCHRSSFDAALPGYITSEAAKKVINSVSYHEYPLNVCGSNKHANSIFDLLANTAVDDNIPKLAPFVTAAGQAGVPMYIGEGNSVACGGQTNVSDVFASALWAVDSLFTHAAAGLQRWNFHGCYHGAYTAIAYADPSQDIPQVNPLYYGMWAFTAATAKHATVLGKTVKSTNELIKVWPTRDNTGVWRVTAVHKDVNATQGAQVTVFLPPGMGAEEGAAAPTASLVRLVASSGSPWASTGLVFGGLTFDGSTDGKPVGKPISEPVSPNSDGSYTFALPPTSVAILTIGA